MCVGKTLNMDRCSKFWGNLEGIWGNPGEIPHIGWKIPGVHMVFYHSTVHVLRGDVLIPYSRTTKKLQENSSNLFVKIMRQFTSYLHHLFR